MRASADEFLVETVEDTPTVRESLGRFLELEHPVLSSFHDLELAPGEVRVCRRRRDGVPAAENPYPGEGAAAILLQAASAAAFFGSRGFPVEARDLDAACVQDWNGAPHLWLTRMPRSVRAAGRGVEPWPATMAGLITSLFPSKGRAARGPADPAALALLETALEPRRAPARPDAWIAEIIRRFPFLGGEKFSGVRKRCAGFRPLGVDEREREHRARSLQARLRLQNQHPCLFVPGKSPLLPGEALRASFGRPFREGTPAVLAEMLEREAGDRSPWIRLDPGQWDSASMAAFVTAARRLGVEVLDVEARATPLRADELREAVWIPSPDLASSVELYEILDAACRSDPSGTRRIVSRFLASDRFPEFLRAGVLPESFREAEPGLAARDLSRLSREGRRAIGVFLANPGCRDQAEVDRITGPGVFGNAAAELAAGGWLLEDEEPGGWRVPDPSSRTDLLAAFNAEEIRAFHEEWIPRLEDPVIRAEFAGRAGRLDLLRAAAEEIFIEAPGRRRRDLDPISRLVSESLGPAAPPAARSHEALRLAESGETAAARSIWESLAADPGCRPDIALEARFRLAAAWERSRSTSHARELLAEILECPASGSVARSRAARGLCRMALCVGDFSEAERRLAEAEALDGAPEEEHLKTVLLCADLHSRRGEFDRESELFDRFRDRVRRIGSEDLQVRFLLHEGMSLSDRREHEGAALRFAEALAAAGQDPERRGAALMDLAIATDHLGDAARSEAFFEEARHCLERGDDAALRRCALGNLASFHLDHQNDASAAPLIEELLRDSESDGDGIGRLMALAARARLRLRLGQFAAAAADRREALRLCEKIEDRVARAELEIEESDGCLFAGDREESWRFARLAASRPSDRGRACELAAGRLADLDRWARERDPAAAFGAEDVEAAFRRDAIGTAERVARARAFFGEPLQNESPAACARARAVLTQIGRGGFVAAVFRSSAADPTALRALRDRLRQEDLPLRVVDGGGREVWRSPSFREAAWCRDIRCDERSFRLEGGSEDPDVTAILFESLWAPADVAAADSRQGTGLEICGRMGILSADPSMETLGVRLARVATQNVTVFISGESGTGKEMVARAVHRLSPRASHSFFPVNAAAFPEHLLEDELFGHVRGAFTGADRDRAGLFEAAEKGTLFLDEIGDLSPSLQSKLLRALQEREIKRLGENRYRAVDVRLISATARNLEKEIEEGRFREDLYYRIKVANLRLPPLRERGGDAVLLARHFLEKYAVEYSKGRLKLSSAAVAALRASSWPGNVRQLQNIVMEAAALADAGGTIGLDDLPPTFNPSDREQGAGNYRQRVDAFRRRVVAEALVRSGGNRTHAARDLGLTRQALLYLIKSLEVRA